MAGASASGRWAPTTELPAEIRNPVPDFDWSAASEWDNEKLTHPRHIKKGAEWSDGDVRDSIQLNESQYKALVFDLKHIYKTQFKDNPDSPDNPSRDAKLAALKDVTQKWAAAFNIPTKGMALQHLLYERFKRFFTIDRRGPKSAVETPKSKKKRPRALAEPNDTDNSGQESSNLPVSRHVVKKTRVDHDEKIQAELAPTVIQHDRQRSAYQAELAQILVENMRSGAVNLYPANSYLYNDEGILLTFNDFNVSAFIQQLEQDHMFDRSVDGLSTPDLMPLVATEVDPAIVKRCFRGTRIQSLANLLHVAYINGSNPIFAHVYNVIDEPFREGTLPLRESCKTDATPDEPLRETTLPLRESSKIDGAPDPPRSRGSSVSTDHDYDDRVREARNWTGGRSAGSNNHTSELTSEEQLARLSAREQDNPTGALFDPQTQLQIDCYDPSQAEMEDEDPANKSDNSETNDDPPLPAPPDVDTDKVQQAFDAIANSPALERLDQQTWTEMCTFFKRRQDDFRSNVDLQPDVCRPIMPHQALAIYWCLTRHKHYHGGIIGDEQGLGKTTVAVLVAYMNRLVHRNKMDIRAFRRGEKAKYRHRHPNDEVGECPDQSKIPIQCSCARDSVTAKILTKVGPNLLIVPASVLPNWITEFKKIFGEDTPCKLLIAHAFKAPGFANLSRDDTGWHVVLTNADTYEPMVQQNDIFVITTFGCYSKYIWRSIGHGKIIWKSGGVRVLDHPRNPRDIKITHISWSTCIIDEMHFVKSEEHSAFSSVLKYQVQGDPFLWPMSGTPWTFGPKDLLPWMNHFVKIWDAKGKKTSPDEVLNEQNRLREPRLTNIQKTFDGFVRAQGNDDELKARALEPGFNKALRVFKKQLAVLLIRRTDDSRLPDGSRMVDLGPMTVTDEKIVSSPETLQILKNYGETMKKTIRLAAQTRRGKSIKASSEKSLSVIFNLHHFRWRPVCSFPYLAEMLSRGDFEMGNAFKDYPFSEDGWNAPQCQQRGWYRDGGGDQLLRQSAAQLLKSSVRMQYTIKFIQALLDQEKKTATNGKNEDSPLPEKLVIITEYPVLVAVISECIQLKFPQTKTGVFGSFLNLKIRNTVIVNFQGLEEKPKSPPIKILIGTVGTLGTGVTLHAARYMIYFEPSVNSTKEKQAYKRVHRIGQKRPVFVKRLLTPGIQVEDSITDREMFWRMVAELRTTEDGKATDGSTQDGQTMGSLTTVGDTLGQPALEPTAAVSSGNTQGQATLSTGGGTLPSTELDLEDQNGAARSLFTILDGFPPGFGRRRSTSSDDDE